ncbi:MAG: glycine oxidase ThiO, glycine oxidase [Candidatus Rokubacteria bacterium CSP1-6]|nr:MAG: glycine oxidase ThiO, glycine oxidase [Candidatus Rokubacteria bacterium CSP1-6]
MARTADILVVGGGVIGCAIAYELAKAGLAVTLVERGTPGCEASSAGAGMLAPQAESSAASPRLGLGLASKALYADLALELRERIGLDIEYETGGNLHCFLDEGDEAVGRAACAWQREAGLKAELLSRADALALEPDLSPEVRGALFLPEDHWVNNPRLVTALAGAAALEGVRFITGEATAFLRAGDRVTGAQVGEDQVRAAVVVLAAGAWSGQLAATAGLRLPVGPVRGQIVCLEGIPRRHRHLLHIKDHYLVSRVNGEILIGASVEWAGFAKQVTAEYVRSALDAAIRLAPALARLPIKATWAGFRPWAPDELPIIGAWPGLDGLVVATGHFRNGILLAPITGRLIRELLVDHAPSLDLTPFLPDRFAREVTR